MIPPEDLDELGRPIRWDGAAITWREWIACPHATHLDSTCPGCRTQLNADGAQSIANGNAAGAWRMAAFRCNTCATITVYDRGADGKQWVNVTADINALF